MPQYLAPGVYVEEVDTGIKTIEGVSTSVAGMVGATMRGPIQGLPQLVTSFADFERLFGGYFSVGAGFPGHHALPYAVSGFFTNGGRQLYVVRVANGATAAYKETSGGVLTRLTTNVLHTTPTKFTPTSLLGIQENSEIQFRVDGTTPDLTNVPKVTSIDRLSGEVTVNAAIEVANLPTDFNSAKTTVLVNPTAVRPPSIKLLAAEPGSWGMAIEVTVKPKAATTAEVDTFDTPSATITLTTQSTAFYPLAWIEVDRGKSKILRKVTVVSSTTGTSPVTTLTIDSYHSNDFVAEITGTPVLVTAWEFDLTITSGTSTESYLGLTLENVPTKFIVDRLKNSALVTVELPPLMTNDPLSFPAADNGVSFRLDQPGLNIDGNSPTINNYIGGGDPGSRTGIKALEDIDRISIIAAPGQTNVNIQNALIEQCERLKDRFAILDPDGTTVKNVTDQKSQFDTKYAAIYYPNLVTFDPVSGNNITIPPSGHMAGLYARVDIERGVHKAPANEVVRGIIDFAATINKETQDLLNPSPTNINVFRDFRADGRGLRIWGARVMTSDTSWKYINVRRLFLFLEESIDEGTQWVVFEPNDAPLWARVTQSISAFLTRVWRDGALQGAKAEEAFFVKCDHTTMTQDDIDNGKLIAIVGVAPVKPAEFVIIRISQWTAGASAA